jgi:hypothetical protein
MLLVLLTFLIFELLCVAGLVYLLAAEGHLRRRQGVAAEPPGDPLPSR